MPLLWPIIFNVRTFAKTRKSPLECPISSNCFRKKRGFFTLRNSVSIFFLKKTTLPPLTSSLLSDIYRYTKRKSHVLHHLFVFAFSWLQATKSLSGCAAREIVHSLFIEGGAHYRSAIPCQTPIPPSSLEREDRGGS